MNIFTRFLCIAAGSGVCGFVGYLLTGAVARWAQDRFVRSDEDLSVLYVSMLASIAVFALAGAGLGHWLHARRRMKMRGHP